VGENRFSLSMHPEKSPPCEVFKQIAHRPQYTTTRCYRAVMYVTFQPHWGAVHTDSLWGGARSDCSVLQLLIQQLFQ